MTPLDLPSGYEVYGQQLDPERVKAVRRRLYQDLFEYGISFREISWWKKAACWFPHLRDSEEVINLQNALPSSLRQGTPCEPQILIAPPEEGSYDYIPHPHIDQEPPWANGRKYRAIIGVPLTDFNIMNGGVRFWPFDSDKTYVPDMSPGDFFVMHPKLPHSGGPNLSGGPREAVYFRYLE